MSFSMKWDPVYGNVSPEFLERKSYGGAIGDIGSALNAVANDFRQDQTNSALMNIAQLATNKDALAERPNVLAQFDQMGKAIDQKAVLEALLSKTDALGNQDAKNLATGLKLDQITDNDVVAQRAAASGLGNQYLDPITQAMAGNTATKLAAEQQAFDNKIKEATTASNVALNNSQIKQNDVSIANTIAQNPDKVINKTVYDENGVAHIVEETVSGTGSILGAITGTGLSQDYGSRIAKAESGGTKNPDKAKNPKSTATGRGQFINSTWLDMVKRNRPDIAKGKSDEQILALRSDGKLSDEMTQKYGEENAAKLKANNLPVTDGTVYLAHFAGPDKAMELLRAAPGASAETIMGAKATRDNEKVLKGKTAQEVIAWATERMGGSAKSTASNPKVKPGVGFEGKSVDTARAKFKAFQETQNAKDVISNGMRSTVAEDQKYNEFLTTKGYTGTFMNNRWGDNSQIYNAMTGLTNKPLWDTLNNKERMEVLEHVSSQNKAKSGFFGDNISYQSMVNEARNYMSAKRKEAAAAQKQASFTQYDTLAAEVYEANKASYPGITLDMARKIVDPQLFKEYDRVRKAQSKKETLSVSNKKK